MSGRKRRTHVRTIGCLAKALVRHRGAPKRGERDWESKESKAGGPLPARSLTHADESAMNATVRRRTNRYYVMIISPFVVSKINTTERPRLCIFMQHHNI